MENYDIPELVRSIKKEFLTYRNGIVAETLRKAGLDYKLIFGLQLPQISQIALRLPHIPELAQALWDDSSVRESRLLACYLFDPGYIDMQKAISLANEVNNSEEADILSFRLLKRLPSAADLAESLEDGTTPQTRYCAKALRRNLE